MEQKQNPCFRCKQVYNDPLELSCHHWLCQNCLLRAILKKNLLELPDKESLIIKCKCKNGSNDLPVTKIGEILKKRATLSTISCKKHNLGVIEFCKECNKYLCSKCMESHSDLFTNHDLTKMVDEKNNQLSVNVGGNRCSNHNKEYNTYCKNCKQSFCNVCINEPEIMKNHEDHEKIPYKDYLDKVIELNNKLQFPNIDSFSNYVKKVETEFDKNFNDNLTSTSKILENVINVVKSMLDEFKKKMEAKMAKKNLILNIIKRTYEVYYKDLKETLEGNSNIMLLKYLSKTYPEFNEVTFNSELDSIIEKLNTIKESIEKEDIGNSIKISYSYFAKKELSLKHKIKNEFKTAINDILELKDGRIVACSEDNSIKIFDKEEFKCTHILNGHLSGVRSICALKEKLASGSADKTIRIWDLKKFKTIQTLKEHSNPIINLTLLNNNYLASCSLRQIIIYDDKLKSKYNLTEHTNLVREFIQLEKNKYASCSDDGSIKIYDKHFRTLNSFKDHFESVYCICQLRDGRIISGDKSGKLLVWSKNLTYTKEFKEHTNAICKVKQLKDGRIVTVSEDKTVKIWDLDFRVVSNFNEHSGAVNCVTILREGGLASGGADGIINIWN